MAYGAALPPGEAERQLALPRVTFAPEGCLGQQLQKPVEAGEVGERFGRAFGTRIGALTLRPGARAALEAARAQRVRMAVILDPYERRRLWPLLRRLGVDAFCDVVIGEDDAARSASAPDGHLAALAGLGLPGTEVVAVEALPRGCRAAYGAGLRCAAIPSEVAPDLRFPSSAVRLPALPGADLPGLLRGLPPPSGDPPLAEEPCAPPPTGRPRAVIWDLDGTIAELLVDRAWAKVFADHGLEPPPDWGRYLDAEDPYQVRPLPWLRGQVGPELDPAAVQAALADHLYALRDGDPVRPGVRALLAALAQAGVRQAVATANRGDDLPQRLEEWGVAPFLDAVVTPWHVAYSKPAPDLFLHAAAALGVAPGEALAIEDSPMGALGAVRAGLHCLVVPNAVTRRLRFPAAARRIETLEGMDAATVLGAGG